jgi:cytochrome c oxidase subunit 2
MTRQGAMTSKLLFSSLFFLLGTGAAQAQPGEALYAACVACHGADGTGNVALNAPALAGQLPDYLERQLQHFKSGVRGADPKDTPGQQMRGMASSLGDDAAIAAVVAYIGTLSPAQGTAVEYDQRNGENQYNAACGACHGGKAQGNTALNAPRLAGLDAAYLNRQYRNFAAGIRGSNADDRYGRQMKMMASVLTSEKDINDVMGYIVSQ